MSMVFSYHIWLPTADAPWRHSSERLLYSERLLSAERANRLGGVVMGCGFDSHLD